MLPRRQLRCSTTPMAQIPAEPRGSRGPPYPISWLGPTLPHGQVAVAADRDIESTADELHRPRKTTAPWTTAPTMTTAAGKCRPQICSPRLGLTLGHGPYVSSRRHAWSLDKPSLGPCHPCLAYVRRTAATPVAASPVAGIQLMVLKRHGWGFLYLEC